MTTTIAPSPPEHPAPIPPAALARLRARFRGALLRPGEEGYEEARRVWNGAIDRRPALIARCAGTDDVALAVRFARERDLPLSVRGGGHAVAGHAVCDDGVMIDLSLMKAVRVDPGARTVRAAGGLVWGELDRATQRHGLATTGGMISHTGVAGLTLGGGLGHLMRRYGLTADNLLAVDLVTAEGETSRVDAQHEPELFWGLRGGGGNFGIATALELRLHPVGPLVLGGPMFWSIEHAPAILRLVAEMAGDAPDELGIALNACLAPPLPFLPQERYGTPVIGLMVVWCGDPARGQEAIAPLRAAAEPIADVVRPVPYVALQTMLDNGAPHGMHYYWRSHRVHAVSDAVIDVVMASVETLPTPTSQVNGWVMGGAVSRVAPDATAVGPREPGIDLNVAASWPPADPGGERHVAWVRERWEALRPHSAGLYVNFVSDEGAEGVRAAYGERLARLTALKDRWDPDNVFRHNANVPPSRAPGASR